MEMKSRSISATDVADIGPFHVDDGHRPKFQAMAIADVDGKDLAAPRWRANGPPVEAPISIMVLPVVDGKRFHGLFQFQPPRPT